MNITWLLLALGAAITNSAHQAMISYAVSLNRFSKFTIAFFTTAFAAPILFFISYLRGFPAVSEKFWMAIGTTVVLNFIAMPIMLKAYEIGEFSSVYSMILLTPVFLLFTSFVLIGERPTFYGGAGVMLTVVGLGYLTNSARDKHQEAGHFLKGPLLGVLVAFIYSISTNYDKLGAQYSDAIFSAATGSLFLAILNGIYLLFKYRKAPMADDFKFSNFLILLPLGLILALTQIIHNSALLYGLVSYTIAVKRIGILFGVVWGWLFFKEKDIAKKFIGAGVAVSGVILILFS